MLVTTGLSNTAFHVLLIRLQFLVVIKSELCQTSFPSFCQCALPSEVAVLSVLFYLNLSRLPFLRQVVNLDLLLCAGFE